MSQVWENLPVGVPEDLKDTSLYYDRNLVEADRYTKGVFRAKTALLLCSLCTWQRKEGKACPQCGCENTRELRAGERIDVIETRRIAQLRRKVTECWNQVEDPFTGEWQAHPLTIVEVPVVNLSGEGLGPPECHMETRCKSCGAVYGKIKGRAATPQEIADCKAGKISKPSPREKWMGAGTGADTR